MRRIGLVATVGLAVLSLAAPARAGMFGDVMDALRFAGFVIDTDTNRVSNSSVGVIAQNFTGNVIDFGPADVALTGPITVLGQQGGRGIPELELILSTGLLNVNPNGVARVGPAQPLAYTFNLDTGSNATNITGNVLLDARARINRFGSYDLQFQFSNRQTTDVRGRFDDVPMGDNNFDIGPVNIEGNIVADILATATDGFFDANGLENPFALFSGRLFRERQSQKTADILQAKIEAGEALTQAELDELTGLVFVSELLGDETPDLGFLSEDVEVVAAPEPGGLVLLAGGVLILRRRGRRI